MDEGKLHKDILEAAAVYFGWKNWENYCNSRRRNSKALKTKVYNMSIIEKAAMLRAIKSVSEYEKENGEIILNN